MENQNNQSSWKENLLFLAAAITVAIIIRLFIFEIAVVKQTSMYPTLVPSQWLGVSKISYSIAEPKRGDIAIIKADGRNLIKRVIGRPNETIEIKSNKVYINGEELNEQYISSELQYPDYEKATIPEGCYFMMGDNRPVSLDSRYEEIGFVPQKDFVGRAIFRIMPPSWFPRLSYN